MLFFVINTLLIGQCISQPYYKPAPWIKSFLQQHPAFSTVNIKVNGKCQLDKFFVNRKGYKENYATIYKDSLCNIHASSGKFELGIAIDSFQNAYFWQELVLEDSSNIKLDIDYQDLKNDFEFDKLLLEQNLENDTIEWIQVSHNHWFDIVDTLNIYRQNDSLKMEWTSMKKQGNVSKITQVKKELSQAHFDLLRSTEKRLIDSLEQSKGIRFNQGCKDSYAYHILTYSNVKKTFIEGDCTDKYWKTIRAEILKK